MHYIYGYEICSLCFLFVVAAKFFESKMFPNILNRIFGIIIYFSIADIGLDILSSIVIENTAFLPAWAVYTVNMLFYSMQVIFPGFLMIYVMNITGLFLNSRKMQLLISVPLLVAELLILTDPFTGLIFYVTSSGEYIHGIAFPFLYVGTLFYFAITLLMINNRRKQITWQQYTTITCFIAVIVTAMIIQYFYREMLLTGVAVALAVTMIFFTLENPENMRDAMTGTFNYSAMLMMLGESGPKAKKLSIAAADISGITEINEIFGLEAGNNVIKSIGDFFSRLRGVWTFRVIGTRFLLVSDSEQNLEQAVSEVSARFADSWKTGDASTRLLERTVLFDDMSGINGTEELLNCIDVALAGKSETGGVILIDRSCMDRIKRRTGIRKMISRELKSEDSNFEIWFQPIYSVKEARFISAEVLLRYRGGELGCISPGEFIPIAEQAGSILRIDEMVLERTCDFLNRHDIKREFGLDSIEVNLSAAEFLDINVLNRIGRLLEAQRADASKIIFEITETAAMSSFESVEKYMKALKRLGSRFALDDFGTGYANFIQIARLPFSIVKVDRTLLDSGSAILDDSVSMIRHMGMKTVIEGVETELQKDMALRTGAEFIQGFYYAHPMPEEKLISFFGGAD